MHRYRIYDAFTTVPTGFVRSLSAKTVVIDDDDDDDDSEAGEEVPQPLVPSEKSAQPGKASSRKQMDVVVNVGEMAAPPTRGATSMLTRQKSPCVSE